MILQFSETAHSFTDHDNSTCVASEDIISTAKGPIFTTAVNNVTTNLLIVQLYYGETDDTDVCDILGNILFTSFPAQSGCDYFKECTKIWECSENRICENQCHCNGTGTCVLNVIRSGSEDDWSICEIRV